jgi:hypothetical protein
MRRPLIPFIPRRLYRTLGTFFFALGTLGIGVPLLPTVPFWILAAIFFTRSSPELRDRIYNHPRFGRQVQDFVEYGAISRRGKVYAVLGITLGVSFSVWLAPPPQWVLALLVVIVIGAVSYVISRPTPR